MRGEYFRDEGYMGQAKGISEGERVGREDESGSGRGESERG